MLLRRLQGVKLVSVLGILAAGFMMSSVAQRPGMAALQVNPGSPDNVIARKSGATTPGLSKLPLSAQSAIAETVGRDDAAYHAVAQGNGFHVSNPKHGFSANFTRQGVQVRTGMAHWGMQLKGYGYGSASIAAAAAAPHATANRVEYRRGTMTEWYVNGPLGLEQGFTLTAPPTKGVGTPLTLTLDLSGDISASLDTVGKTLTLTQAGRGSALRYRGLVASDANGRDLRAWLELKDKALLIRVEDHDARYPVIVDPFVQEAKLTPLDANSYIGAVAISGDTVVAGSEYSYPQVASAFVFIKPPTGWAAMTESVKLTTSDGGQEGNILGVYQGTSVAMSASGDTILLGAPGPGGAPGAVYVFVKPAGGWVPMTETAKLTASDEALAIARQTTSSFGFGDAVAISSDTVVVGAPLRPGHFDVGSGLNYGGSAYLFVKPAGGWASMTETALIPSQGFAGQPAFGNSVAISGDTVVVGSYCDIHGGSVLVFVKPAEGWPTTVAPAPFDIILNSSYWPSILYGCGFGASVAIGGDANTIFVGDTTANAVDVFVKPNGGWEYMTESAKLTVSDQPPYSIDLGISMALSGDRLVIGADYSDAAYVFVKPATGWTTTSGFDEKVSGVPGDGFGGLNALGISGDTVAVGGPNNGWAYVFGIPPGPCDDGNPCTDDFGDASTGCVHTNNTATCNDGNPNTAFDVCSGGVCAGEDHCVGVICTAIDPCHDAGVCVDHATGACSNPIHSCDDHNPCTDDSCGVASGCAHTNNTAPCDDGNPSTVGDVCSGGFCGGVDHCIGVICSAIDQCHDAGVCLDHASGACTNPNKANGTACNDQDACTTNDTCTNGVCGHLVGTPIAAYSRTTCAVRRDGRLACWGSDVAGEVSGPNASADSYTDIGAGYEFTCALRIDGRLVCWGSDFYGEVSGPNTSNDRYTAVSSGEHQTCALRTDGRIVCWGTDLYGEVSGPNASADAYLAVSTGNGETCAVRVDGRLMCWGFDNYGDISGPNASADSYTAISTGNSLTCAVRVDGRLACWGFAQDPLGNPIDVISGPNSSVASYTAIRNGYFSACALRTDGRLACWGYDGGGIGSTIYGQVSGPDASIDSYSAISSGGFVTCALRADRRIACWGVDTGHQVSGPNASTDTFGIVQGNPLDCDDHNTCTDDSCDSSTGCVHNNNTAACDDGNPNTIGDVCAGGHCAGVDRCAGVICSPGDQCHNPGVCNSSTGVCSAATPKPDGTTCTDGNACSTNDACLAGTCTGGPPPTCDDGDVCTIDICSPSSGCMHTPGNAGAVCRASAGVCDPAETCTGTDATCPGDAKSTAVCRASAGGCDVAESCDGVNNNCPVDGFQSSATVCRPAAGQCDVAESCTGMSAACPADGLAPNGTSCSDGNACTQDTCNTGVCMGIFSWTGVLQPINGDGTSIFKLGSTVPVKFKLTSPCVPTGTFTAKIFLAKITNSILGSEVEATSTAAADTGNTFRYDASGDQYIYNLATKAFTNGSTTPMSAGTWQIRIAQFNGNTEVVTMGTVNISLTK
jgi:hypothetical protein